MTPLPTIPRTDFIALGAAYLNSLEWEPGYREELISKGHDPMEACMREAAEELDAFLEDQKIEYGDPAYDWSEDGVV